MTEMDDDDLALDLVIRRLEVLQAAAKSARAHADALKEIAFEAWMAFDEAEDAAVDAEAAVLEWREVADGDVSIEEFSKLQNADYQPFSFD